MNLSTNSESSIGKSAEHLMLYAESAWLFVVLTKLLVRIKVWLVSRDDFADRRHVGLRWCLSWIATLCASSVLIR